MLKCISQPTHTHNLQHKMIKHSSGNCCVSCGYVSFFFLHHSHFPLYFSTFENWHRWWAQMRCQNGEKREKCYMCHSINICGVCVPIEKAFLTWCSLSHLVFDVMRYIRKCIFCISNSSLRIYHQLKWWNFHFFPNLIPLVRKTNEFWVIWQCVTGCAKSPTNDIFTPLSSSH